MDIHTVHVEFHFIKCQFTFVCEQTAVWEFLRGIELCFKGNVVLMNIPIPHEITSCNNAFAPGLKDILQMLRTTLGTHVNKDLLNMQVFLVYLHTLQVDCILAYECSLLISHFLPKCFLMLYYVHG